MKKLILLLIASLITSQAHAFTYGKFKLSVGSGYSDAEEVVFLMNSAGKIKVLENDDYIDVYTSVFFSQTTILVNTGEGQEDFVLASITLDNNKAIDKCSAWVDAKNGYLSKLNPSSLKLERWNKFKKVYEDISQIESSRNCFEILLQEREEEEI